MNKKSKIVIHIIMLFVVIILAVVVMFAMIDKVRNNDSLNDTFIFNEEVSLNTNLFYSERLGEYIDFETVQGNLHLYAVEIDQDENEADITMIWIKDEGREIITSTVLSAPGERFTSKEITNWDEITEKYEQVHNKVDREYESNVRSVVLVVLLFALPAIMIIVIRIILIIKSNRKKLTND